MKLLKKIICCIVLASLLVTPVSAASNLDYVPIKVATSLYIDCANIGKADSFLLTKNGKSMLVDTGLTEDWAVIKDMLEARTVTNLKAIVVTHYDKDHAGSFLDLMKYMKANNRTVEHIYARKYTSDQLNILTPERRGYYVKFINGLLIYLGRSSEVFDTTSYNTVAVATKANELFGSGNGLWIFPTKTNSIANFTLDGNTTITWLNKWDSYIVPTLSTEDDIAAAINNDSLTFKLTYDTGDTMLFLGDISWGPQSDLVNEFPSDIKNATIIKIPHHGITNYQNPVLRQAWDTKSKPKYSICTPNLAAQDMSILNAQGWGNLYYTKKITSSDINTLPSFYTMVLRQLVENNSHVFVETRFPKAQ